MLDAAHALGMPIRRIELGNELDVLGPARGPGDADGRVVRQEGDTLDRGDQVPLSECAGRGVGVRLSAAPGDDRQTGWNGGCDGRRAARTPWPFTTTAGATRPATQRPKPVRGPGGPDPRPAEAPRQGIRASPGWSGRVGDRMELQPHRRAAGHLGERARRCRLRAGAPLRARGRPGGPPPARPQQAACGAVRQPTAGFGAGPATVRFAPTAVGEAIGELYPALHGGPRCVVSRFPARRGSRGPGSPG